MQFAKRAIITALVGLTFFVMLANTKYDFDFAAVWEYRWSFLKGLGVTVLATLGAYVIGLVLGVEVAIHGWVGTLGVVVSFRVFFTARKQRYYVVIFFWSHYVFLKVWWCK